MALGRTSPQPLKLKSAKGAVSRHHPMKELSVNAARTRPVLRVFLKAQRALSRATMQ